MSIHTLQDLCYAYNVADPVREALFALQDRITELEAKRKPLSDEPYESPYNPNPVEYQYHYPDGSWRCSNGEVINGMHPDIARSLYALKDNT